MRMESFYTGSGDDKLYTVYHAPTKFRAGNIGIVMCYPLGQEFIRSHKAYVRLANRLGDEGFHVIRFDFYGCGDSYGDLELATVTKWVEDIRRVLSDFNQALGLGGVYLLGTRFGATLALMYSSIFEVDGLVLIAPILDGAEYIKEIKRGHEKWLDEAFARPSVINKETEISGFYFPDNLIAEIKSISLGDLLFKVGRSGLVLESNDKSFKSLSTLPKEIKFSFLSIINDNFWIKNKDLENVSLVPIEDIDAICDWMNLQ